MRSHCRSQVFKGNTNTVETHIQPTQQLGRVAPVLRDEASRLKSFAVISIPTIQTSRRRAHRGPPQSLAHINHVLFL